MITSEMKKDIIAKYGKTPEDTGSPELDCTVISTHQ